MSSNRVLPRAAVTIILIIRVFVNIGERCDDLERGTRRVKSLRRAVEQRSALLIGHKRLPVLPKRVRIKIRF